MRGGTEVKQKSKCLFGEESTREERSVTDTVAAAAAGVAACGDNGGYE